MNDWSSFEKDKKATDEWRSYLNEGLADVMSGFVGGLKKSGEPQPLKPSPLKDQKGPFIEIFWLKSRF